VSWRVVARRDVDVLRADRSFLLFPGFFGLLAAAMAYAFTRGPASTPLSSGLALLFLFAVPLTAGTVTHEAIPSAVSSGRIRLALSLPHSRPAFLAGTGVARLAVTVVGIATAVATSVVVFAVRGGAIAPVEVAAVVALGALLGAAFVAATLALTAGSASTTLATASTYAFFVLSLFWPIVVSVAAALAESELGVDLASSTVDAIVLGSPLFAYGNALGVVGIQTVSTSGQSSPWVGVVVLAAWTGLGFALAAARFGRVDL